MIKDKDVESIHISTLKTVLAMVVRDSKSSDPLVVADFIVDKFLCDLGLYGKIGKNHGHLEFYSKFATLDFPYENGRQVFILEG